MNKCKLINKQTGLETLCDKVTIDGFDYYVSGNYKDGDYVILPLSNTFVKCVNGTTFIEGTQKVIATNNPNIDIPKVVDEVERLKFIYNEGENKDVFTTGVLTGIEIGYNKSQETHPFSEEDVKEIFKIAQMQKNYGDYKPYTFEEAIQLWKKERPKTLYYEKIT